MKLLVIFTGGTIGSRLSGGWIAPDGKMPYRLLESYRSAHPDSGIEFETVAPYTVLSENLCAEHLNLLIASLWENRAKGYDGIIVTHGTDTLQYSASAAAYALGNALPVVFVSANYPLEDPASNGEANFAAAVALIESGKKGVFVAYRNHGGAVYFHRANRLLSHGEADDEVFSLWKERAGSYENGGLSFVQEKEEAVKALGSFSLCDSSGILLLQAHPGDGYAYSLEGVKAILCKPYHSGTLNTESAAFQAFCARAKEKKLPFFAVNMPQGESYESAKSYEALGIIPLPPCALIPLYMKLWIALSRGEEPVSFLKTPLCGEY